MPRGSRRFLSLYASLWGCFVITQLCATASMSWSFIELGRALLFHWDSSPSNAFFHQNMNVLRNPNSDIRWKHLPAAYFKLEDMIMPRFGSIFCVKEDAVVAYRERFRSASRDFTLFQRGWIQRSFTPHRTRTASRSAAGLAPNLQSRWMPGWSLQSGGSIRRRTRHCLSGHLKGRWLRIVICD